MKGECQFKKHPLDDMYEASPEALGSADIVVETSAKNCSKPL